MQSWSERKTFQNLHLVIGNIIGGRQTEDWMTQTFKRVRACCNIGRSRTWLQAYRRESGTKSYFQNKNKYKMIKIKVDPLQNSRSRTVVKSISTKYVIYIVY